MLIRNARDCAGKPIEVWLRDGKIAAVGLGLLVPEGEELLDAKGRTILPAFLDTHCHWRTPGFEYKEDISTGSAAAAAGGYTFVNLMPNTTLRSPTPLRPRPPAWGSAMPTRPSRSRRTLTAKRSTT